MDRRRPFGIWIGECSTVESHRRTTRGAAVGRKYCLTGGTRSRCALLAATTCTRDNLEDGKGEEKPLPKKPQKITRKNRGGDTQKDPGKKLLRLEIPQSYHDTSFFKEISGRNTKIENIVAVHTDNGVQNQHPYVYFLFAHLRGKSSHSSSQRELSCSFCFLALSQGRCSRHVRCFTKSVSSCSKNTS